MLVPGYSSAVWWMSLRSGGLAATARLNASQAWFCFEDDRPEIYDTISTTRTSAMRPPTMRDMYGRYRSTYPSSRWASVLVSNSCRWADFMESCQVSGFRCRAVDQ